MPDKSTKSEAARAHYDQAAESAPDFTVMNYGFSDESDQDRADTAGGQRPIGESTGRALPSIVSAGEREFYCLRLYEHAVRDTELSGRDVLEVSCGRGGGAAFLARSFSPRRYVGIDLSEQNVRLAQVRESAANLEFEVGDAEALAAPDASFDVVVNIEASHLYDDRKAFFSEVHRVLKPGGRFCYVDGCWRGDDLEPDLRAAGFELLERRDITRNVLRALRLDSARREAIVDAMPQALQEQFKDWSGVVGHRAFRRFEQGETLYFSFLLRRP